MSINFILDFLPTLQERLASQFDARLRFVMPGEIELALDGEEKRVLGAGDLVLQRAPMRPVYGP
jgi:hypothetical protein